VHLVREYCHCRSKDDIFAVLLGNRGNTRLVQVSNTEEAKMNDVR